MTCPLCSQDRNQYCPTCLGCGQRYLAAIQASAFPRETKVAMWRKALADWREFGHAESELRAPLQSNSTSARSAKKGAQRDPR